ncbi:MAG: hypothetical protein H6823_07295 [Planctomycetaceae bacterium]|nr:hypothetical protein [Planctomycetales bacterium]MCB9938028.1 hypothetical protein [Planctomycetaceae bacterium]
MSHNNPVSSIASRNEEASVTLTEVVKGADLKEKLSRQMEPSLNGTVPNPWP